VTRDDNNNNHNNNNNVDGDDIRHSAEAVKDTAHIHILCITGMTKPFMYYYYHHHHHP
jgi:hypothetical protein